MSDSKFDEIKLKVEAILFAYGDYLTPNDIMQAIGLDSQKLVDNSLEELEKKYSEGFPYTVYKNEAGTKWKMGLKEEFEDSVSELVSGVEIPKSVLKVLSVIAYDQPITKTRLNEILGRSVKQEVDYLYKAKFVNYEKVGVGKYYRVTKKFYDYFKINEEDFNSKVKENLNVLPEEPVEAEEISEETQN